MNTYQFRSNIKCGGCVQNVSPVLNSFPGIQSWSVDTASAEKKLNIQGEIDVEALKAALLKIGYKIEN